MGGVAHRLPRGTSARRPPKRNHFNGNNNNAYKLLSVSKINVVENCVAKTAIIDEEQKKKTKTICNSNNVDSNNSTAPKVGKTEK